MPRACKRLCTAKADRSRSRGTAGRAQAWPVFCAPAARGSLEAMTRFPNPGMPDGPRGVLEHSSTIILPFLTGSGAEAPTIILPFPVKVRSKRAEERCREQAPRPAQGLVVFS